MEQRDEQSPDETPEEYGEDEWEELIKDARDEEDLPAGEGQ